jgi:hypothetical protein
MPPVGFEPRIPAFERAKKAHALDRKATVIGLKTFWQQKSSVGDFWKPLKLA